MRCNGIKYFIIIFTLIFTTSCNGSVDSMNLDKYKDYSFQGIEPIIVDNIPNDYISLNDVSVKYGNLITISFFESQIYVLDLDGNNIKQTSISNADFLVQYKDDLYINETEISEVLPLAEQTSHERSKVYCIGDPIDTFTSFSDPAIATIEKVLYEESYEDFPIQSDEWICVITMSIEDDYDESFRAYAKEYNLGWRYFNRAETTDGEEYTDVLEVDTDEIIIKLPKKIKIKYLYIQSPSNQITLRKVDISQ